MLNMKKIYIVLSYTGTLLSRIVKIYTKKEYSHVSISLDKNLNHMYSFGRINPYNPVWAGFVQESPKYGTFKRFKNAKTKIYSMEVSDEDYKMIKDEIHNIARDRKNYKYNLIGLITVIGNYHLKRNNAFYCAEFVKHVLSCSNLQIDLPEVIKPDDFERIEGLDVVYTGRLREYDLM